MPIEVKELHIKGVIGNESPGANGSNNTGGTGNQEQQEAIIAACVEKVLQILADKKER